MSKVGKLEKIRFFGKKKMRKCIQNKGKKDGKEVNHGLINT